MSESWRRKTYYRTRVLVDVDRVLEPQFGDSLLCITGAQLEMLRNLTQYLHRRSTFVAEYESGTYLTADQEDWDDIQAIVADLEETLMGCEDITTQLTAIASQLSCLCSAAQAQNLVSPGTDLIVRDYLDDGTLVPADDYTYSTPPADERCEIAQVTYWQAWEVFTETLLPLAEATSDVLMGLILASLASVLGCYNRRHSRCDRLGNLCRPGIPHHRRHDIRLHKRIQSQRGRAYLCSLSRVGNVLS